MRTLPDESIEAVEHVWQSDLGTTAMSGFAMNSGPFAAAFPFSLAGVPIVTLIVSLALILFVFATLLTWSYYGERAITFIYDRVPGSTRDVRRGGAPGVSTQLLSVLIASP